MKYTAVIRTLGKAGAKYQILLDSLVRQTIPPDRIIVYIAEGFQKPRETAGKEEYIYVKKGMVAQRALEYREVSTEYILFLDDDVYLPEDSVEQMFSYLVNYEADVIAADTFLNAKRSLGGKLLMTLSGRMLARKDDGKWGYKVMRNSGYSYNSNPRPGVYWSQTNAGPCFFCSKVNFLKIHFNEELWLDDLKYAMGDDQVMFYKMYLCGLRQLTWFGSGIVHLDAGTAMTGEDREKSRIYSDFRFKTIFWYRFIYSPEQVWITRQWAKICIGYTFIFSILASVLKCRTDIAKLKLEAINDAVQFIESPVYKSLSSINDFR